MYPYFVVLRNYSITLLVMVAEVLLEFYYTFKLIIDLLYTNLYDS